MYNKILGTKHFIKAAEIREQRRPKRKSWILKCPILCRRADKILKVTNRTQKEGPGAQVQINSGEIMEIKVEIARSWSPTLDTNLLCGKGHAI